MVGTLFHYKPKPALYFLKSLKLYYISHWGYQEGNPELRYVSSL